MSKVLTEKQQKFLEALFGEAEGNHTKAKRIAGYSENTSASEVTKHLSQEIHDALMEYIKISGPAAVFSVQGVLKNPTALGNRETLAAAKDLLDRAGAKPSEKIEVTAASPIFYLPAKE